MKSGFVIAGTSSSALRIIYAGGVEVLNFYSTGLNSSGQLALNNTTNSLSFSGNDFGNWNDVACGNTHVMVKRTGTNQWYAAGNNSSGQLGLGTVTTPYTFLTPVIGEWEKMACGYSFTLAKSAGTNRWFATGENTLGAWGQGNSTNSTSFIQLTGEWDNIVCDSYHTVALSAGTNEWFSAGSGNAGQLGLGNTSNNSSYTMITGKYTKVDCGHRYTMLLSGTDLYATGSNFSGQLGLGNSGIGTDRVSPTRVAGLWNDVSCSTSTTFALSASGNLWHASGLNSSGEMGQGTISNRTTFEILTGDWSVIQSAKYKTTGASHTMALSSGTNQWFAAGGNSFGGLGLNSLNPSFNSFTPIPGFWSKMACGGENFTIALSSIIF